VIIEEIVDGSEPTDQPTCLPAEVLAKDSRAAGLPMPEPFELKPEVSAAPEVGR
jgi:hypothetical protein